MTAVLVAGLLSLAGAGRADAAGIVTHAWMAETAVDATRDPGLRALLAAHADQVRAGAEFPDGGYLAARLGIPGGGYGEEAHWQRFVDAYLARIRSRTDCGALTDPAGPCAPVVAHLLGVAAHGMGDEVWDWLFEPNAPDLDEQFIPPELAAVVGPGGIEIQMDVIAIVDHARPTGPTPPLPSEADVLAAFAAVGRPDVTPLALAVGDLGLELLRGAQALGGPLYADRIRAAMPWTSSHIVSANGGVDFAARTIASYWDDLWLRLQGRTTTTRVAATAPVDGQTGVPARGWVRPYEPGSDPRDGGAATRIVAFLNHGLPYNASATDPTHLTDPLPRSVMRLTERDTGRAVMPMAGYPRVAPYNKPPRLEPDLWPRDFGEHAVAFQPAADLAPCTWYRVDVTAELIDADGNPVAPTSWTFRTACSRPHHGHHHRPRDR
jgi:hypothetical protein